MKKTLLLFTLFTCTLAWNTAKAGETEPNDDRATANTLALNGSNTGAIGTSTDVDWWKVTTTGDGKLDVIIDISNSEYMWCTIYDNDGSIVVASDYTNGTKTISANGLAAGTYYMKLYPYYSGHMPAYTISNVLTVPAEANDAEPNNSRATAKNLPLNSSKTGHVNYYYNNNRDSFDWYKITTTADGRIRLTVTSGNGQNVWAELYDNNGATQLAAAYTTGTAVLVNKDGLAAGTYYVRIRTFFNNEFVPYTLSDSLFSPAIPNDTEPDSTIVQAINLPVNSSANGHVNYYYNNHQDSVDWYKITTYVDGRLRLTMTSGNGQNVWAELFDNNGTTQIAGSYTTATAIVVNADGLAAGTYYVRVRTYYNSEFAPYTLSDSLFSPTEPNDTEPNNSAVTALTLPLNGSVTGHLNYYYNNIKDSFDWYKIVTTADGRLQLNVTSGNGQNVWGELWDSTATNIIAANYTTGSGFVVDVDGLTAGTYYVRTRTYYNSEFAPYTLSSTFTGYANANDAEPNDYFTQATSIQSNSTITGHVSFSNYNHRDGIDIFKLNYTGDGNLTLQFNQENRIRYGSASPTWIQVYKDTAASPIYSNYFYSASNPINLTNLKKNGYYYIKVFTYYNNNFQEFGSYSITNSYVQVEPIVKVASYDTISTCGNHNSIKFKISKSGSSTVQLYRFGLSYGSAVVTDKTATFKNLPTGTYYATAIADGVNGNIVGTSKSIVMMVAPTNPSTTNISVTGATLNWTLVSCAKYYAVQYRVHGTTTWTKRKTNGNVASYALTGLVASTTYDWEVASVDSANNQTATSDYTDSTVFSTPASFIAGLNNSSDLSKTNSENNNAQVLLYPNPATTKFRVQWNTNENVSIALKDMNGKTVWQSSNANSLKPGMDVDVSKYPNGIYYLQITDTKNNTTTRKVVISR